MPFGEYLKVPDDIELFYNAVFGLQMHSKCIVLGSIWGITVSWIVFGKYLGSFWELFGEVTMRKKNYKGRCEKRSLEKFTSICKTYDPIQSAYADVLVKNKDIAEVRCNVALDGEECCEYMTDFVCIKTDRDLMVRECCQRKHLTKPQTTTLLDLSRSYWLRRGVTDWGIVVDAAEE